MPTSPNESGIRGPQARGGNQPPLPALGSPFLTVVARLPQDVEAIRPLRELLVSTRLLILFADELLERPASEFSLREQLTAADTSLGILPVGTLPPDGASDPAQRLELGLRHPGCRSDPSSLSTTLVLTAELDVYVVRGAAPCEVEPLCRLGADDFAQAWSRHVVERAASFAQDHLVPVISPIESAQLETADHEPRECLADHCVELEHLTSELAHERDVLRLNRDCARAEHLAELEAHQQLNDRARSEIDACHQELEVRAKLIESLRSTLNEHEAGLVRYQTHVTELEEILRRTRAHKIQKWLDRWGHLRGRQRGSSD